jgi:hypothetical protein
MAMAAAGWRNKYPQWRIFNNVMKIFSNGVNAMA